MNRDSTRLSLRFSRKLKNLQAACAMSQAYAKDVWRTRLPKESGRYCRPAAMAAGVVKNLWSFENLYEEVTAT